MKSIHVNTFILRSFGSRSFPFHTHTGLMNDGFYRALFHKRLFNSTVHIVPSHARISDSLLQPILQVYREGDQTPVSLFRMQQTRRVRLREFHESCKKYKSYQYDVKILEDGLIHPNYFDFYQGPNGLRLMQDSIDTRYLISSYEVNRMITYVIPKGTPIPKDMVLVHDYEERYTLQPTQKISLKDFQDSLTLYLNTCAEQLNQVEYMAQYPYICPLGPPKENPFD